MVFNKSDGFLGNFIGQVFLFNDHFAVSGDGCSTGSFFAPDVRVNEKIMVNAAHMGLVNVIEVPAEGFIKSIGIIKTSLMGNGMVTVTEVPLPYHRCCVACGL